MRPVNYETASDLISISFAEQGQRDLALKNSQKTYKHQIMRQLREEGVVDAQIYGKIKQDMQAIKKVDVPPRAFPAQAAELSKPENALKVGNPLYATSSMGYGGVQPAQQDMPNKFFPRPEAFTSTFLGGQFQDTGLHTASTKSRLPSHWDP